MLGNGARFLGPSAGSTNNINNQHQTQFNRSIWPTATTTFQANGSECKSKILLFILYRIFCILSFRICAQQFTIFFILLSRKKSSFSLQKQKCNNNLTKYWKKCLSAYTNFKQNIFCTLLMQTEFMQALSSFSFVFWIWCQWTLFHQHQKMFAYFFFYKNESFKFLWNFLNEQFLKISKSLIHQQMIL